MSLYSTPQVSRTTKAYIRNMGPVIIEIPQCPLPLTSKLHMYLWCISFKSWNGSCYLLDSTLHQIMKFDLCLIAIGLLCVLSAAALNMDSVGWKWGSPWMVSNCTMIIYSRTPEWHLPSGIPMLFACIVVWFPYHPFAGLRKAVPLPIILILHIYWLDDLRSKAPHISSAMSLALLRVRQ